MTDRGTRRRATVNYTTVQLESTEGSNTPSWLTSKRVRRSSAGADLASKENVGVARNQKAPLGTKGGFAPDKAKAALKARKSAVVIKIDAKEPALPVKSRVRGQTSEGSTDAVPSKKPSRTSKGAQKTAAVPVPRASAHDAGSKSPHVPSPPSTRPSRRSAPSPTSGATALAAAKGVSSKRISGNKHAATAVPEAEVQPISKRRRTAADSQTATQSGAPPPHLPFLPPHIIRTICMYPTQTYLCIHARISRPPLAVRPPTAPVAFL